MSAPPRAQAFADFLFDRRWPLSVAFLVLLALLTHEGIGAAQRRSEAVGELAGVRPGPGGAPMKILDPRMDIWFHQGDEALAAFQRIDEGFIGEDYILLVFEEAEDPLGVFGRRSLEAISRLTEELLEVPGVRHVRSLTSLPWIRWGQIQSHGGGRGEAGLIVTDLFEKSPAEYSDDELIRRMVAVLGGPRALELVGEAAVRAALGPGIDPATRIGEPGFVGTLVGEDGRVTAIQIQVLRRRPSPEAVAAAFPPGDPGAAVGQELAAAEGQFRALQGIDRVVRVEAGLARPSEARRELEAWLAKQTDPAVRNRWRRELSDWTASHVQGPDGAWVRLWDEVEPDESGGFRALGDSPPPPPGYAPTPRSPYRFRAVGVPYFNRNFMEVGQRDMRFVGLMFAVLALALLAIFRTLGGVVLPLVVIGSAVIGAFSVAWYLGDFLDNLTAVTPNMLTAVGMGDAVHLLTSYTLYRSRGGWNSPAELVRAVVRANSLPVFLTSVTTAIGFASLGMTGMIPLVKLSYVATFGVVFCYLLSMSWIPAVLSLVPLPGGGTEEGAGTGPTPEEGAGARDLAARVRAYIDWILRSRRLLVGGTAMITAVALYGVSQIRVDSDPRSQLPPGNKLMLDFDFVEERLGGIGDLELLFRSSAVTVDRARVAELEARRAALAIAEENGDPAPPGAPLEEVEAELAGLARRRIGVSPEFLATLARFVDRLRDEARQPGAALVSLSGITSPLDILRKIHQVQNENRPEAYRIPTEDDVSEAARRGRVVYDDILEETSYTPPQDGASLVAQYYLQYETGARPGENLGTQLSANRQEVRVQGRLKQAAYGDTLAAIDRIEEIAREEFPTLAGTAEAVRAGEALCELDVTGQTRLFSEVGRRFIVTFLQSISVALLLITLVIALTFRSLRLAAISLVPNVLPIALPLGLFGLVGEPLGPAVVLVASIALGVCVDDTIHFFTKFSRRHDAGTPIRAALEYALTEVGGALTSTSVVLVLGFFALQFSDFRVSQMMGRLAVVMIALAWVADLVVTPAVLATFAPDEPRTSDGSPGAPASVDASSDPPTTEETP